MKPSKHFMPGAAMASLLLHQQLLSLLIHKHIFSRDEIFEHLESTMLAAEELHSHLDAAKTGGADHLSVGAARSHIENIRMILQIRHPQADDSSPLR